MCGIFDGDCGFIFKMSIGYWVDSKLFIVKVIGEIDGCNRGEGIGCF